MKTQKKLKPGFSMRENGKIEHKFTYMGSRFSVYGSTYKECLEKKLEKIKKIDSGDITSKDTSSNITLEAYYKIWQDRRVGTISESTRYANDIKFNRVVPPLGAQKLTKITTSMVKMTQNRLKNGKLSPKSANESIVLLEQVLQSAVEDNLISSNPCKPIKPLKVVREESENHRALTKEEQDTFFSYAKKYSWYYTFYKFLILTGLRGGEASAVMWSDVDEKKNVIHITKTWMRVSNTEWKIGPPKTGSSRRDIPITDAIKEVLKEQKELYHSLPCKYEDEYVFCSSIGTTLNRNLANDGIRSVINRIRRETGYDIPHFSLHAFRSTFATRAIEQGMKPNTLKKILGHSKITITLDIYAKVLDDTKYEEMSALDIMGNTM